MVRDRISLANDQVVLIYATAASMGGETWDFPSAEPSPGPPPILVLDHDQHEVILDGKVLDPPLRGKLYDLLKVLYDNRGRAVSEVEIMKAAYKDRPWGPAPLRHGKETQEPQPLVDYQEVNTFRYTASASAWSHTMT